MGNSSGDLYEGCRVALRTEFLQKNSEDISPWIKGKRVLVFK